MKTVVAIYIDPDFYPPTINAIINLAEYMEEVIVISRNNSIADYPYPKNVRLIKIGKYISVRDSEKLPVWRKVFFFLKFTASLIKHTKSKTINLLVLYDSFALLSFYLIRQVRHGKKIWYHNHDMPDTSMLKKYSVGSFAAKYEKQAMHYINFFSLPAEERLQFYTGLHSSVHFFFLPNYPSLKVYANVEKRIFPVKSIKIIYQGFIGEGHSIETLLELLQEKIDGIEFTLVLKGSVTANYKAALNALANKYAVTDKIKWMEIGPYSTLPQLTASCDIGIGINSKADTVSQFQGTASNKIYEYAACGLPVLLYDSPQYKKHLQKYTWAFFTEGSLSSIRDNIKKIKLNLPALSEAATSAFKNELNFENYFIPALKKVMESV